MDESAFILKAQAGNQDAYADLFGKYKSTLRGYAFKILKNEEDAEEAASDAFTKGIKTYDPGKGAKFSTWLHTITKNVCRDLLRKKKRRPEEREDQEEEGWSAGTNPTGSKGWTESEDDPKNLLIVAQDEQEQAKRVEEARKIKESRKSRLYDQCVERILRHVRPEFLKAIKSKWHSRPDRDFLKGVLTKGLLTDPEPEFEDLRGAPVEVVLHTKRVLLPPNRPGKRITGKPSVQFFLDPHFSYQRTEEIDGEPRSDFDLIQINILAPGSPQDAKRCLDKAMRDLSRLGFDDRFRKSYLKNAELQFEKYLRPIATRNAGEILDEFFRILGNIRGDHLWGVLVTEPATGVKDEVARTDLEEIISPRKTPRELIAISHKAKGSIIAKFLDADEKEEKRIYERIMSRHRRGK